jgi:hypothetical protein
MSSVGQRQRLSRAFDQRFYVVNVWRDRETWSFRTSGSTGTLYEVSLSYNHVHCDCPDFQQRGDQFWCKHLCFVAVVVLRLSRDLIGGHLPLNAFENIQERVQNQPESGPHQQWSPTTTTTTTSSTALSRVVPVDKITNAEAGTDCMVCYQSFQDDVTASRCRQCRNIVHVECLQEWLKYNNSCIFCRALVTFV